jgi:4-alpha-glucanotransferase
VISAAERSALRQLADLYGIQRSYQAMGGRRVTATPDATRAVLASLGADVDGGDARAVLQSEEEKLWQSMLEPVVVAWDGQLRDVVIRLPATSARKSIHYQITLEDGTAVSGASSARRKATREKKLGRSKFVETTFSIPEQLPIGYHELRVRTDGGSAQATIFAAPLQCFPGVAHQIWGVFTPLYALRANRGKAIGDFSDLDQLLSWVTLQGGNVVATLPISASFLTEPFDPSPYSPASRLYWNELFLDIDRLLANTDCIPARNRAGADDWHYRMQSAAHGEYVDYRMIAELKRHVLEALADWFYLQRREQSADFNDFLRLYPDVEQYARFRAASERQARSWPNWPPRMRQGTLEAQDYDDDAMRYHMYAQFVAHQQLEALAERSRIEHASLYLDMPLGVHPDSYDVWRRPDLFVRGASAGAPPDPFFTKGQTWGFPPLNPKTQREQRYDYLRRVLRTQFRYARVLRIDHVMSLHRLFFVPNGFEATDGVYVRYPESEMYAVLTIESQRHQSAVVGEDLGTVAAEVRKSMKRHGVKRMFVLQFEATDSEPPVGEPPTEAVVSLNTHDMPPFAAYWNGADAELRHELGLLSTDEVDEHHETRDRIARQLGALLRKMRLLDDGKLDRVLNKKLDAHDALHALLHWLALSRADILLVNLEDLWLEEQPQNVPGTGQERPNWRRRMSHTLDEIRSSEEVRNVLRSISAARHSRKDGRSK